MPSNNTSTTTTTTTNNIQVAVRCRPLKPGEQQILTTDQFRGNKVTIDSSHSSSQQKTYTFDHVFGELTDQSMVYSDVGAPIVEEMLQGYNCTIFAYGMTGTGKTYTMSMDEKDNLNYKDGLDISAGAGIIPRALHSIFNTLENSHSECSVRVSYIELYNEDLRDLLSLNYKPPTSSSNGGGGDSLKMYGDPKGKGGVIIQGLEETLVNSADMAFEAFERGSRRRRIASTNCNEYSSRSHSVFTITVHIKDFNEKGDEIVKIGKLNLVDLAGSENIGRSGAVDLRAREAGNINSSLLALGRVINGLVERSDKNRSKKPGDKSLDKSYIPYRDSKLTRLLQDSLGGETKTFIIATISPSKSSIEETLSTLDYALRAKSIENKPQVQQKTSKNMYINDLVAENVKIKSDFKSSIDSNGGMWMTKDKVQLFDYLQENKEKCDKEREQFIAAEKEHINTLQKLDSADNELIIKRNKITSLENLNVDLIRSLDNERFIESIRSRGERINFEAANEWIKNALLGFNDIERLHNILDTKNINDEKDRNQLINYREIMNDTVGKCVRHSNEYRELINRLNHDTESSKMSMIESLKTLPTFTDCELNGLRGIIKHYFEELCDNKDIEKNEDEFIDKVEINSNGLKNVINNIVNEINNVTNKVSNNLISIVESELMKFNKNIGGMFKEYQSLSHFKLEQFEDDVKLLKSLNDSLEGYSIENVRKLEESKRKLNEFHHIQLKRSKDRSQRIIQLLTKVEEEEAKDLDENLIPIDKSIDNLITLNDVHKAGNMDKLTTLISNMGKHSTDKNEEIENQSKMWNEVKNSLKQVQTGIQNTINENETVVKINNQKLVDEGILNVDEIENDCKSSRKRIKIDREHKAILRNNYDDQINQRLDGMNNSLIDINERLTFNFNSLSRLVESYEDCSNNSSRDIGKMVDELKIYNDNLNKDLQLLKEFSDNEIIEKRQWPNENTFDLQIVKSREDILNEISDNFKKRYSSDNVNMNFDNNSNEDGNENRQGSAPPEMSPRKNTYTLSNTISNFNNMNTSNVVDNKGNESDTKPNETKLSESNNIKTIDVKNVKNDEDIKNIEKEDTKKVQPKGSSNVRASTRRQPLRVTSGNVPRQTRSSNTNGINNTNNGGVKRRIIRNH